MGVTGLWKVLDSTGHPIKLEVLERKVLSVDANIWLHKFIKGFRDRNDGLNLNAHKIGLFIRLCKLLYYKINPIFVFDGPAPQLKRRTLEQRQDRRNKGLARAQSAALKVLVDQIRNNYPDADLSKIIVNVPQLASHNLAAANNLGDDDMDLFRVDGPNPPVLTVSDDDYESDYDLDIHQNMGSVSSYNHSQSQSKSSASRIKLESNDRRNFGGSDDFSKIDIESEDFLMLPPEVRHEILTSMKESKRRIRACHPLPEEADNFSNFQLDRLRQKRAIQEKIDNAEREICSTISATTEIDLEELKDKKRAIVESYRVISDPTNRMVYLKDLSERKINTQQNIKLESGKSLDDSLTSQSDYLNDSEDNDLSKKHRNFSPIKSSLKEYLSQEKKTDFTEIGRGIVMNIATSQSKSAGKKRRRKTVSVKKDVPVNQLCLSPSGSSDSSELETGKKICQNNKIMDDDTDIEEIPGDEDLKNPSQNSSKSTDYPKFSSQEVIDVTEEESLISSDSTSSDDFIELIHDSSSTKNDKEKSQGLGGVKQLEELTNHPKSVSANFAEKEESVKPIAIETDAEYELDYDPDLDSAVNTQEIFENDSRELSDSLSQPLHSAQPVLSPQPRSSSQPFYSSHHSSQPDVSSQPGPSSQPSLATLSVEELESLKRQMNREERHANSMTEKIVRESKELLELFGVPFIVAHGEAEAQCAALESMKMTDGTITDDSDVWLFGAQTVYRHFFADDKWVMQYKINDIHQHLHLTRENLICMAMMVGSDYTVGIDGVGPVTALEILSEFPGDGLLPLKRFKKWLGKSSNNRNKIMNKKREHFLKLKLPEDFPSRAVYNGYLKPAADESREPFSWGKPRFDELRQYALRHFGWTQAKIDDTLNPVIKKISEKQSQTRIDSYLIKNPGSETVFRSKRVNAALNTISRVPLKKSTTKRRNG